MMRQAALFEKLAGDKVKCLACSWYCRISSDQVGICGTRLNKNGDLYSLVYGKAIGLHNDPVEKKPLFHFLPNSKLLSFGTVGCNFGCLFCQNWDMSQVNKVAYQKPALSEVEGSKFKSKEEYLIDLIDKMSTSISPKEIVEMAINKGADGIAYTYNEPAIFVEFAHDTAKIARKRGLKNVYVSNGFESKETFDYLKDYLDAINIDLKSFKNEFYLKVCKAKIEPVKENIKRFFESRIETEVTTLIIPNYNDSSEELEDIAGFLAGISKDIPWHISAFYPAYKLTDAPPTPHQTLIKAHDIGKKVGLKFIYVGNILDEKRSSTYCPKCKDILIWRSGYLVEVKNLNSQKGACKHCEEKIYGVWN